MLKQRKIRISVLLIIIISLCLASGINSDIKAEKYVGQATNSPIPLKLVSAYGDSEATHPKVIAFDDKWNGWKYWMTFTPYPSADDSKENPHIKVSNDKISWKDPGKNVNPLDGTPENYERGVCYNSDPHLVYNDDTDQLECWWRYVDDSLDQVIIYRMCSVDGIKWQPKENIIERKRTQEDFLSPALLYEDGMYKMWYIGKEYIFYYIESEDLIEWSEPKAISVPGTSEPMGMWHIDIIHEGDIYEVVFCGFDRKTDPQRRNMSLYYTTSTDNTSYTDPVLLLSPTFGTDCWDNRGLYRPCILLEKGEYYLYYSGIQDTEARGVGLSVVRTMNEFLMNN